MTKTHQQNVAMLLTIVFIVSDCVFQNLQIVTGELFIFFVFLEKKEWSPEVF